MAVCSDPRITYLNKLGYNVVKVPRSDLEPLHVLGRDNKALDDLGQLSTIWTSSIAEPKSAVAEATNINGSSTEDLKISVGLDILGSVLGAMGVKAPKLSVAYSKAKKLQFTFTNVKIVRVAPLEVGKYLSHGDLDTSSPFASFFLDHEREAYVVTEVMKSSSIKVTAKDEHGTKVSVDLPDIKQIVGASASVEPASSNDSELIYEGKEMLAFGFKVYGISFANGMWTIHGQPAKGGMAYAAAHEPEAILLASGLMTGLPIRKADAARK